jgi:hypothetical protein
MSSLARFELLKNFNAPCADLTTMAERELSAFFNAITNCSGQNRQSFPAEDWLQELIEIDDLPVSSRERRLITAKVSTRLASQVNASSPSTEPQIT